MLHRTRHLFIRQQTAVINAIRAHLAEFGIVAPVGRNGVEELLGVVADASDKRLPEIARACLAALGAQRGCSDGRYGGHRSAMHARRIIIQTLHPASGTTCIIPPQELSHLVGGEKWAIVAEAPAAGPQGG